MASSDITHFWAHRELVRLKIGPPLLQQHDPVWDGDDGAERRAADQRYWGLPQLVSKKGPRAPLPDAVVPRPD